MRKILFRGKRIDSGEWEYGGCVFTENKVCLIYNQTHSIDLKGCTVEENSVGQYTGLTDKNGKKIFEGDILKVRDELSLFDEYNSEEICYNGKVMYIENQGMYVCEGNGYENALCALNLDECQVIGNIHDNPELLEVEK